MYKNIHSIVWSCNMYDRKVRKNRIRDDGDIALEENDG